jgi:dihydrolipoamide dehydrogenase
LTVQKDFASLLKAAALVARERPIRVLILGEGPERPALEKLVVDLGLSGRAHLPGFTPNPYPALARASALVLSSAFEGFGVILVEALSRLIPIPGIEPECAVTLQREMRKRGVQIHLNRTVERADAAEGRLRVTIGPSPPGPRAGARESAPQVEEVEKVLVSVGRVPNSRDMGLDGMGLELDGRGWVRVNDLMETNVPHVYGVGDLLGPSKVMLAHVASAEGIVAAENAVGDHRSLDYGAIPSGVFTSPEVACVGLTEAEARGAGHDAEAETFLFRGLGKAQALGEIAGQAKLVWEASTGKILGVHLIGPHATDLIAEGTLALRMGATVRDLASTIHAHPTLSEVLAEAAHKAMGAPIHALRGGAGTRGPIR